MAARLGELVARLSADTGTFRRDMGRASTIAQRNGQRIKKSLAFLPKLFAGAAIARGLSSAIRTFAEFESAVSNLGAITGATGDQLDFLASKARELASVTTLTANQAVEAFTLIASAKPELLENSRALAAVTKEAVTLAEASKTELAPAANALASALNQYSAGAEEAARFTNVLAAGAKFGASFVEDTAAALQKAGLEAKNAGISFEQLNAVIQSLASVALKGEESGTKLRNIFIKLQTQSNDKFNPAIVGLTAALDNLAAANLSTAEMTKLVEIRSLSALRRIIDQRREIAILTEKITGTNIAYEQQAKNIDNLQGRWKLLISASQNFAIQINNQGTALKNLTGFFTTVLTNATKYHQMLSLSGLEMERWLIRALRMGAGIKELDAGFNRLLATVSFGGLAEAFRTNAAALMNEANDMLVRAGKLEQLQIESANRLANAGTTAPKALEPPKPPPTVDLEKATTSFEELLKPIIQQNIALQAQVGGYEALHEQITAAIQINDQLKSQKMAELTLEQKNQVWALVEANQALEQTIQDQAEAQRKAAAEAARAERAADSLGFTFSSAFENAIVQGEKLRDVMQGLARDVLRVFARRTVTEPLGNAVSAFVQSTFPGFAGGGITRGGPILVGERGPEIINPPGGSRVTPNNKIGGDTNVTINFTQDQTRSEAPFIVRSVMGAIADARRRGDPAFI